MSPVPQPLGTIDGKILKAAYKGLSNPVVHTAAGKDNLLPWTEQSLESDASVVVVGDVNPGASVCAKGNVVVLGCAKGYLSAGCDGDDHAFVAALDMQPMQIRIGKHIARSADGEPEKKKKLFGRSKNNDNQPMEAQIAFVEDENIYIEPISKALLNEIIV